jgi:hypothetical protein
MYNKTTRSANTGRPRGADYVVVVVGAAISIVTPCVYSHFQFGDFSKFNVDGNVRGR